MIGTADRVLRQCEALIEQGNLEDARKCAAGLSILTGQSAWERAYLSIIDNKNTLIEVCDHFCDLPDGLRDKLNSLHDKDGKQYPDQSVRGGTQINLTDDPEIRSWLEALTQQTLIGAWSTRLECGGFHVPHIHPRGEQSHVLYVDIPSTAGGRLYFGVPRYLNRKPVFHRAPENGLLVSFPCWLWHGVTQYGGLEPRLALAFDTHG